MNDTYVMNQAVKNICWTLMDDEKGEGDMNIFLTEAVVQALHHQLICVRTCDRPYKNIRLTEKGWRI